MNTTLINIKTDKKLKNQVRQFLPNKKTAALLRQASRDFRAGKNIAGPFSTPAEANAYLDSSC